MTSSEHDGTNGESGRESTPARPDPPQSQPQSQPWPQPQPHSQSQPQHEPQSQPQYGGPGGTPPPGPAFGRGYRNQVTPLPGPASDLREPLFRRLLRRLGSRR